MNSNNNNNSNNNSNHIELNSMNNPIQND